MLHVLNAADAWLTHQADHRKEGHVTGMNDNSPFPNDTEVLVRFARSGQQADRSAWPWLPGVIQQRMGEDEWQVCVEDMSVAALEDGTTPPDDDLWFPTCYRDRSELRTAPRER